MALAEKLILGQSAIQTAFRPFNALIYDKLYVKLIHQIWPFEYCLVILKIV
jgi:hypothetical protein